MTRRARVLALAAVLVLGMVVGLLVIARFKATDAAARTSHGHVIGFGPTPNAQGAAYAVDFATVDPLDPFGEDLRVITVGQVESPPGILDKTLTQGASVSQNAASYFERKFASPVRQIGLNVTFPATGDTASAVALLMTDGPVPNFTTNQKRPDIGIHLVVLKNRWELGVWPSQGQLELIATGLFDLHKFPGPASYEVLRFGSTARIIQPDGKITEVTDSRIAQYSGSWGTWELFQNAGGIVSPRINSLWAL